MGQTSSKSHKLKQTSKQALTPPQTPAPTPQVKLNIRRAFTPPPTSSPIPPPSIIGDFKRPKKGHVINGVSIEVVQGDITDEATDAIVNPTDEKMGLTGNLSKAILAKGGQSIEMECKAIGTLKDVALTSAGSLKCQPHRTCALARKYDRMHKRCACHTPSLRFTKVQIDRNPSDRRVAR